MVEILPRVFELDYLGSKVPVDTVKIDDLVIYKINLSHPLFIKKVITDGKTASWHEEGSGETKEATMLGKLIEARLQSKKGSLVMAG